MGALDLFPAFHGRRCGGERQRLFIALALLHQPELLVLDEVTTGLDAHARREVLELIAALPSRGVTVLLVTHALDDASRLCDRVAVMVEGRLVALDAPAALQGAGSLEDAYLELAG